MIIPRRQQIERTVWDEVARTRRDTVVADLFTQVENDFWLCEVVTRLGSVQGKQILDCGCGEGRLSAYLAHQRAMVWGLDIAEEMLRNARELNCAGNGPGLMLAAMERLPFADGSFDFVTGSYVLHHVELEPALAELQRVLKPGGSGVFVETWGKNPLLLLARQYLTGRLGIAKHGTSTEHPLMPGDIAHMRQIFTEVKVSFPMFVCFAKAASNLFEWRGPMLPVARAMVRMDRMLERAFCNINPWGYYCVVELRKATKTERRER